MEYKSAICRTEILHQPQDVVGRMSLDLALDVDESVRFGFGLLKDIASLPGEKLHNTVLLLE